MEEGVSREKRVGEGEAEGEGEGEGEQRGGKEQKTDGGEGERLR